MKNGIKLNSIVVGVAKGNCVCFNQNQTSQSPFVNSYLVNNGKGFNLWLLNNQIFWQDPKRKNVHQGNFVSISQMLAFVKAMAAKQKSVAIKIYQDRSNDIDKYSQLTQNLNLDQADWQRTASKWILQGMLAKFSQDRFAEKVLFNTFWNPLINCSEDMFWGIGNSTVDISSETAKSGQNMQGWFLMQARTILFSNC